MGIMITLLNVFAIPIYELPLILSLLMGMPLHSRVDYGALTFLIASLLMMPVSFMSRATNRKYLLIILAAMMVGISVIFVPEMKFVVQANIKADYPLWYFFFPVLIVFLEWRYVVKSDDYW